jgi:actin-related protein
MYKNIVLTGGSTMLKGLKDRIEFEIRSILKKQESKTSDAENMEIFYDSHRRYATWIGGSMLASMSTFNEFKITQQAYREATTKSLVLKKTF